MAAAIHVLLNEMDLVASKQIGIQEVCIMCREDKLACGFFGDHAIQEQLNKGNGQERMQIAIQLI